MFLMNNMHLLEIIYIMVNTIKTDIKDGFKNEIKL